MLIRYGSWSNPGYNIILVKALGAITYSPAYALNGYRSGVIDRGGKGSLHSSSLERVGMYLFHHRLTLSFHPTGARELPIPVSIDPFPYLS